MLQVRVSRHLAVYRLPLLTKEGQCGLNVFLARESTDMDQELGKTAFAHV